MSINLISDTKFCEMRQIQGRISDKKHNGAIVTCNILINFMMFFVHKMPIQI